MKAILMEVSYDSRAIFYPSKACYKFFGRNNSGDLEFDLVLRSDEYLDMFPNDGDYDIEIIFKKKPKPVDETIITIK
jgi:hypothetical protein